MTTVFQRVGHYEILSQIGEGGMGLVFLAEDTRSRRQVALKLVTNRDPEFVEAERRGVLLQARLSESCPLVPKVFEYGDAPPNYFFIAMEYIEGENLSDIIARGPVEPMRAAEIASGLSRFLDTAHCFDAALDGRPSGALVHGDLKPRNVRITPGNDIKILDFGIAKALSLSRKVTRNDFGSLPYMSPERLDSSDTEVGPSADLWALGVILYELLTGTAPFRAADTRRLEQQIRRGTPRRPLADDLPVGIRAISARLLCASPAARYATAKAVLEDLERFTSGVTTEAENDGFPLRVEDVATRRTRRPAADEATRRTRPGPETTPVAAPRPVLVATAPVPARSAGTPLRRGRVSLRAVLMVLATMIVLNEISVRVAVRAPAARATAVDAEGMDALWDEHSRLQSRSWLGIGVRPLETALRTRSLDLAEQVIANYRGPLPTVRERQWTAAQKNLQRALALAPRDRRIKAALRYSEGHLLRIDGEAEQSRGRRSTANSHFADAVVAFRQAAELQREWPDPFLGLARTFIYGLEDIDRAADALKQAQERGYTIGDREVAQLGDGYRARGDKLRQTARQLAGMPQEEEYLQRALAAYRDARAQYERIPDYGGVATNLRRIRLVSDDIGLRLQQLAFLRGDGIF
jgi:serine/threonine protein kinase